MSGVATHTTEPVVGQGGVPTRSRVRALLTVGSAVAAPVLLAPTAAHAATASAAPRRRNAVVWTSDAMPSVRAPPGKSLALTVNGTPTDRTPGTTRSGALTLAVTQGE